METIDNGHSISSTSSCHKAIKFKWSRDHFNFLAQAYHWNGWSHQILYTGRLCPALAYRSQTTTERSIVRVMINLTFLWPQ